MPTALPMWVGCFVLGVWVGDAIGVGGTAARWLVALIGLGLMGAGALDRLRGWALLGGAVALGVFAQSERAQPFDPLRFAAAYELAIGRSPAQPLDGEPDLQWLCEGQVLRVPTTVAEGVALRIAVTQVAALEPVQDADGTIQRPALVGVSPALLVWVSVRGGLYEPLLPGDRVRLRATLRPPSGFDNPGSIDRIRHAAALGVSAVAFVEAGALMRWDDAPGRETASPLERARLLPGRALARVRARMLGLFEPRLQSPRFALAAALILGERGALLRVDEAARAAGRPGIEASFRAAGIFHVLSVSGLHLAVVSWVFFHGLRLGLQRLCWLTRRFAAASLAALVAVPATLGYTVLTGAELATLRAAGAAVLWLLAVACGRRARLGESLSGAIFWIVAPWPNGTDGTASLLCFEPALQLSVAATLGIAYLRPLDALARPLESGRALPRTGLPASLVSAVRRLVDGTLGATLATLPLCAYYFTEVQGAGLLGNLLAVPIGEFGVLPLGLLSVCVGLVLPGLGDLGLALTGVLAEGMLRVAAVIARLGLVAQVPAPTGAMTLGWALGLVLVARGRRLGWGLCAAALAAYLLAWGLPPSGLLWTALDVGQGDASVLELPGGQVVVIDAGPRAASGLDAGERVVGPFLRRKGHRRIDVLIASHPHPDHIGGMLSLIEQFEIGELWAAPQAPRPADASGAADAAVQPAQARPPTSDAQSEAAWRAVLAAAARRGVKVVPPHALRLGGVSLAVLGPCADPTAAGCAVATHPDWGPNDNSVVLRVDYAGRSLLLAGDAELPAELALLDGQDAGRSLRADLLKAPHHCSQTSSSESLVQAVARGQPLWVVCSVGRQNRFRFPHAQVLARYAQAGAKVMRTDEHGAVTVAISPIGRLRVVSIRGGAVAHAAPGPGS